MLNIKPQKKEELKKQIELFTDEEKQKMLEDIGDLTDETKQMATRTFKKIFAKLDKKKSGGE